MLKPQVNYKNTAKLKMGRSLDSSKRRNLKHNKELLTLLATQTMQMLSQSYIPIHSHQKIYI